MSMINALHETMRSEARSEQHPGNAVFLSPVSIWEALVKSRLGKLSLPASPEIYLPVNGVGTASRPCP